MLSNTVVQRLNSAARGAANGGRGMPNRIPDHKRDRPARQSPTGPNTSGDSVGRSV